MAVSALKMPTLGENAESWAFWPPQVARHIVRIDDDILETVVFIGIEVNGAFTPLGTALLGAHIIKDAEVHVPFLVTANHVIEQIRGDDFWVRLNRKDGSAGVVRVPKKLVHVHHERACDLAIAPIKLDPTVHKVRAFPISRAGHEDAVAKTWKPGIGDEVATVGLYTSHYGITHNQPVVRIGHIAQMPGEPVRTSTGHVSAYLIETKSIAGLSGSPVYLNTPHIRVNNQGSIDVLKGGFVFPIGFMLGYHLVESAEDQIQVKQFQGASGVEGAYSADERNTGFGVVVPVERLFEILESSKFTTQVMTMLANYLAASKFKPSSAPSLAALDGKSASPTNIAEPGSKEAFNSLLSAAVQKPKSDGQT